MLKFFFLVIFLVVTLTPAYNQTTINLTFTAELDGRHQPIDSIFIENLVQYSDTTLYGNDTVLVLEHGIGMEERVSEHDRNMILFPAFPNPVLHTSTIGLRLLQNAPLTMRLYDISGRELMTYSRSLNAGYHNFSFSPGRELIYFLIVEIPGQRLVQKIVAANSNKSSCRLTYSGYEPVTVNMRKNGSVFPWALGDDMLFVGFTADGVDTIYDAPVLSALYTFQYSLYPQGTVHCNPSDPTEVVDVLNPLTGKIWMDRNLGASRVATGSADSLAYGDLYQWGRFSDGHQCRTSNITSTISNTDVPGHGDFIVEPNYPYDWRSPQNDNLWQGINGVNNPCPIGYRLPTNAELNDEINSWSSSNLVGAFNSPLKLPAAGYRSQDGYYFGGVGSRGDYWSSTYSSDYSRGIGILSNIAGSGRYSRGRGRSVRCIKNN